MIKNIYIGICFLFLLSACASFKEKIGLVQYSPNEFETVQHEPLEIPRELELKNPEESYKRKKTTEEKIKSLLISNPARISSSKNHQAEDDLLNKMGSEKRNKNIRQIIDQDNQAEPSLQEKIQRTLVFWKKPEKGKVIDPVTEEKQLRAES